VAAKQHDRGGRTDRDNTAPVTAQRRYSAHACRDGEVLCGRAEVVVRADTRLGLTARERRRVAVRFIEHLHPTLRSELVELVRRRGAIVRRAAERMDWIELVVDDPHTGLQRIIGWLQPPQRRDRDLREIEFDVRVREPAP